MKRKILFLTSFLLFGFVYSQIGMGTANPRGALDINKPTTNNMGLVLPTNETPNNLVNPLGGSIAIGTIMYDSTADCVKVYKSTGWSNCLCDQCDSPLVVSTLDCTAGASTGTYSQGVASSGTKVINYTGGNGKAYGAISIASTGVTGLTATAPAGTAATGNGSITLSISGTPNTSGTASFVVNLGGQSCTFTVRVENDGPIVTNLNCTSGALTGTFTQGTASNGTKVINYTGGNGKAYGAISIPSTGVTGLTATAPAGTLANGNGSITLTINGTSSGTGAANFTVTLGGQTCTFSVNVTQQVRTIRVLSITPDNWRANLSTDSRTTVARSKLNNTSNFGPSGLVKIQGFSYATADVRSNASDQAFRNAIDNADIIWVGYITNGNFSQSKRRILEEKIAEKKKFFFLGADGGTSFFPFSSFGGYQFVSTPNNQNPTISDSNISPAVGIFGNLANGSIIRENRYIGSVSNYPSTALPFMTTQNGRTHAVINDNVIIVGDINWYVNNETRDGFTNGSSSCTQNNNSILFCNIFQEAIEYVQTH